jgi:hypothetical protein
LKFFCKMEKGELYEKLLYREQIVEIFPQKQQFICA